MSPEAYARKLAYNREYARTHPRSRPGRKRVYTPEQRERKREKDRKRVRPARPCEVCGTSFIPKGGKDKRCSRECTYKAKGWGTMPHSRNKPKSYRIYITNCEQCGRLFVGRRQKTKCCSQACYIKRDYRLNASRYLKHAHLRNARLKLVEYEEVEPIKVYERDGWVCQLCGQPVKRETEIKHDPEMASLDHIIPISHGGSHTYGNLQCSHLRCNLAKGNRILAA